MVTSPTTAEDIAKQCEAVPPNLADLIRKYPEIFLDDLPTGLPPSRPEDHRIELEPGAKPTVQRQFRLSQPELEELQQQLDYLLTKGFFRPRTSPYAALILFTPKKDGGFRMCIDYRALNRITIKSRYPIPRADDLLDQLRGAKFFSKIDLRGGYHQIRIAAEDCHKTAFRTRYGSYEYLVMPFGLTNAPSTFHMTINGVFKELLDKFVIIYLDGILIYNRSREQHLQDLDAVFILLHKNRLITKGSKCDFLKQELEFLGHIVSTEGVKIDPKKIKTIQEWKPPTNIKELQSFLGFVNYVRRFIHNMAGLSAPLTDRLKDHVCFWWGEKQQASFDQLKIALTSPPVLRISDPDRPYEVITDASNIAIGSVLLQDFGDGLQPVTYESRKLQLQPSKLPNGSSPTSSGCTDCPPQLFQTRDPKFTSNFWRHLWDQFGTKMQFSSAYHLQTDGQTEQVNQTIEQLIRTTCTDPQTWEKSLPLLEFAYNNAPSPTTHQSPFFLNYRQDPV
ncbi:hypothetical protein CLOP_g3892 [Closterium sp. NIES-67]|nr:hypothetical protein CLOP_g3892 [Closterium sp. NIES-67]